MFDNITALPIIIIVSFTAGWLLRGKPTEEQAKDIPPFGLECVRDISRWTYIEKPSGQLALSPTQLARVFCSMPSVHKGYKNNEADAEETAQATIKAISGANSIRHSTE